MLEDTEKWLYEDGEDQPKQVYEEKLDALKVCLHLLQEGFFLISLVILQTQRSSSFHTLHKCHFPDVGPAHSGPAQRERGQAESI